MELIFLAVKACINAMEADAAAVTAMIDELILASCAKTGTLQPNKHKISADAKERCISLFNVPMPDVSKRERLRNQRETSDTPP